jgi:hypothetical protein
MGLYDTTQARVGLNVQPDGSAMPLRATRMGGLANADSQGHYYEQASRGNLFHLCLPAWTTTIAAGNINAAAAAASTQFALWNPPNSGVRLSLLKFGVFPISGTAPVPSVFHSLSVTAPTIASALSGATAPICADGSAKQPSARYVAHAAGTAITGSTALVIIRAADLFITAGAAANLMGGKVLEYVDGDITLPPNTCWVPTWAAAGTTFLGGYSITWEEIPL